MVKRKLSNKIWIIIPAHNEAGNIASVIDRVKKQSKNIVVVDDGSGDDTFDLANKYGVKVIRHTVNFGKGAALKTGCDFAFDHLGATHVVLMDADGQHDPLDLPELMLGVNEGYDVVLGTRSLNFTAGMPPIRIIGNTSLSVVMKLLFGKYVPDILCGYKIISKRAYPQLRWWSRGYEVEAEMVARLIKHNLRYTIRNVKTVYLSFDRGMTLLDAISLYARVISWRISV